MITADLTMMRYFLSLETQTCANDLRGEPAQDQLRYLHQVNLGKY